MAKRRLFVMLLLALAVAAPQITSAVARGGRPDIVVVMVDDLGAIDERILERLPNIRDLFLDGGLRFDKARGGASGHPTGTSSSGTALTSTTCGPIRSSATT